MKRSRLIVLHDLYYGHDVLVWIPLAHIRTLFFGIIHSHWICTRGVRYDYQGNPKMAKQHMQFEALAWIRPLSTDI